MDFTALDDLTAALVAAGIRDVDTDPAGLNLPGVWVQVVGVGFDNLGCQWIRCRAVCLTGDTTPRRALDTLADLADRVLSVVDPTGEATTATVTLPDGAGPVPGLLIPFDLPAT